MTISDPQPDGLLTPEVGAWSEEKYKLVSLYANLFATGMKYKWGRRVFIDLYAGAGLSKIRSTNRVVWGSPMIALTVNHPFDLYIFCDANRGNVDALRERVARTGTDKEVHFVVGDCNEACEEITALVPRSQPNNGVISLCFIDPFDIGIKFETIRRLAEGRIIDFMILLALYMDANRNYSQYLRPDSTKVDDFLGSNRWRENWGNRGPDRDFPRFLASEFARQMTGLGYIDQPLHKMKKVRSNEKNLPLYRLALFSRSQRAYDFWNEVLKYSSSQRRLFEE